MEYVIKYNRTTNHIDGISIRTTGSGEESGGAVGYYAQSACPSLTRSRNFVAGQSFGSLADALDAAGKGARKLCKTCEKAALAQLESMAADEAPADKFKVSLSKHAQGFLNESGCLQGDEEPEVRAEILALPTRKTGHAVGWVSFYTLGWLADYMDTWVEALENADEDDDEATPEALRSAHATRAKISAQYAEAQRARATREEAAEAVNTTDEGDKVAGKLKLSEVRGDVRVGAVVSGGVIHAIKETDSHGRNIPYCPTRTKDPLRSWGQAHEQKPDLELCVKCSKLTPTGPVEITEEAIEIPGLNRTVTRRVATPVTGTSKETKETEAVATMSKADQDKAVEEIKASMERLRSLVTEGKGDAATELQAEVKTAIELITGRGAAGIKASLRADVEKTVKDAKKAKTAADKAAKDGKPAKGKEVANLATTDLSKVKELPALYESGYHKIVDAAKHRFAAGTNVATVLVAIRSNIRDKDGDPDLPVRQQITRDAASDMYDQVLKQLPEPGEDAEADVVRDTFDGIKTDARRATRTVTVEYVRKLDVEPDPKSETYQEDKDRLEAERAKYKNALEMFPADYMVEDRDHLGNLLLDKDGNTTRRPIKWSERVFDYYEAMGKGFARTTRAEQYAEERRKKAERKKQLEEAVKAGEITQEEADASLSAPAPDKETDPIKRLKNAFDRQISEAKKLEDEDAKASRKDDLIALLASIRKEINAI
ncbi:hypothetical protein [Streptomyces sp. NRRL S-920]|uniref:hypothetical protein n=1 Tax=Streptomyces sp. NRRL S-920 TaxID=1463921 RepID=UPI0004CB83E7|nr:hypothetical protein [Streptomyces sp. NRRL S-920]